MKTLKSKLLIAVLLAFVTVDSCEIFTDEETDKICGENVLNIKVDMPVQYTLTIATNQDYPTAVHKISKATELQFHGYIRKINCNEAEGAYYKLDYTVFPKDKFRIANWPTLGFDVGPQNTFSFANKRDYMSITCKMKLIFDDGRIYESNEIVEKSYRFSDLLMSSSSGAKTITIFLNLPTKWNIVTI